MVLRMQPMSNKHESEIAIVEQLIGEFQQQQVVFTLDALHCQKKPSSKSSTVAMTI